MCEACQLLSGVLLQDPDLTGGHREAVGHPLAGQQLDAVSGHDGVGLPVVDGDDEPAAVGAAPDDLELLGQLRRGGQPGRLGDGRQQRRGPRGVQPGGDVEGPAVPGDGRAVAAGPSA
nr:hypothetical protein GCM10020092_061260 [Actinoplanes digitatis]